jgi:pimeloyl-ACP methyl ester carboxylesterase
LGKKKGVGLLLTIFLILLSDPLTAFGQMSCTEGEQESSSIYRICLPPPGSYNGNLIIWVHGFQNADDPVAIPEDQLRYGDVYLPELAVNLGFGFATNSFSKTGLAVTQGVADIMDLVEIYEIQHGTAENIYLIGASEGGLITTLLLEQNPGVFKAGYALCGPVGDFPYQINYFGHARATFEYFFPNVVPGYGIFNDSSLPISSRKWDEYFEKFVEPLMDSKPSRWKQWVKVAGLPDDPADVNSSILNSAKDALRYTVINLQDAVDTLAGFPFDNSRKWYSGSNNDLLLNLLVKRFSASEKALSNMKSVYNTTGALNDPLITMHTTRDQQVPYFHEMFYNLKSILQGSFLSYHVNIPVNRYGHCRFTAGEALAGFATMLYYSGDLEMLTGVGALLRGEDVEVFESLALRNGIPFEVSGKSLRAVMRK